MSIFGVAREAAAILPRFGIAARLINDPYALQKYSTLTKVDPSRTNAKRYTLNARPLLEVSGGVTLANVGAIARTGVDRISIGRLTHSAPSLDVSLEVP